LDIWLFLILYTLSIKYEEIFGGLLDEQIGHQEGELGTVKLDPRYEPIFDFK